MVPEHGGLIPSPCQSGHSKASGLKSAFAQSPSCRLSAALGLQQGHHRHPGATTVLPLRGTSRQTHTTAPLLPRRGGPILHLSSLKPTLGNAPSLQRPPSPQPAAAHEADCTWPALKQGAPESQLGQAGVQRHPAGHRNKYR